MISNVNIFFVWLRMIRMLFIPNILMTELGPSRSRSSHTPIHKHINKDFPIFIPINEELQCLKIKHCNFTQTLLISLGNVIPTKNVAQCQQVLWNCVGSLQTELRYNTKSNTAATIQHRAQYLEPIFSASDSLRRSPLELQFQPEP